MSRKKCKRKVWALVNPIEFAVSGAAIAPRKDLDQLLLREIGALDAIVKGHGGLKEWQDLAALNNLTMTLAGQAASPLTNRPNWHILGMQDDKRYSRLV